MKKQFLKKTIASTIISGASIIMPSMCEEKVYSNGNEQDSFLNYSLEKKIISEMNYRKLSDTKESRNITSHKKPKNVKKTHKEIVSYAGEVDTLFVPRYQTWGDKGVPMDPPNCARYARFSLEDVFGLKYNYDEDVTPQKRGAWNLKYYNPIVKSSETGFTKEELEEMVEDKVLQPGMMILFYNPRSNYRNWKDKTGKKVDVTHVGGYLGNDISTGKMRIMNQLEEDSRPRDMDYFLDRGWKVRYILNAPNTPENNPNFVEIPKKLNEEYNSNLIKIEDYWFPTYLTGKKS